MKKLLILALAVLAALAGAIPVGAATAIGSGGRADGYAPTPPPGGTGPQAGEIALGSFVAPTRATAGRHGAATGLKADPTCAVQCITSGVAYGRGPDARLVVTTDTPATIRIVVSGPAGYTRQLISGAGVTSFSADFEDLEADTHYDAIVIAKDAADHSAVRSGSFRTLQRNVTVVFNEAHIDAAPYGDQPYYAQTWFEDQPQWPLDLGDADGGVLPLTAQAHQAADTDRYLALALELTQSEEPGGPFDPPCEVQPEPDEPEVGYGDCEYTATAWLADGAFDLDARPAGATDVNAYWMSGTMVLPGDNALPGGYGNPLQFTVPLAVHVSWTH
jgi:hypothetical protein